MQLARKMTLVGEDAAEAFDALVREDGEMLLRVARRLTDDPDDARDLAQEALVRGLGAQDGFRGECSLRTFVLGILVREGARRLRRRDLWRRVSALFSPERSPLGPSPLRDPEAAAELNEEARRFDAALRALPARQRTVLTLRFVEGLSLPEIAALLDVGAGTVKTHLVRGLRRVRAALGDPSPAMQGDEDEPR